MKLLCPMQPGTSCLRRATTRNTARVRSNAPCSDGCRTRWPCGFWTAMCFPATVCEWTLIVNVVSWSSSVRPMPCPARRQARKDKNLRPSCFLPSGAGAPSFALQRAGIHKRTNPPPARRGTCPGLPGWGTRRHLLLGESSPRHLRVPLDGIEDHASALSSIYCWLSFSVFGQFLFLDSEGYRFSHNINCSA